MDPTNSSKTPHSKQSTQRLSVGIIPSSNANDEHSLRPSLMHILELWFTDQPQPLVLKVPHVDVASQGGLYPCKEDLPFPKDALGNMLSSDDILVGI